MKWWLTPEKFQALPGWARAAINATLITIAIVSMILFAKGV